MQSKRVCAILGVYCIAWFSLGALASQQTPEDLAQLWIEAIKANSTAEIRRLIHPACPQASVTPEILARMVGGGLPETYDIENQRTWPPRRTGKNLSSRSGAAADDQISNEYTGGKRKIRAGQRLSDRKGGGRVVFCNLLEVDVTLVARMEPQGDGSASIRPALQPQLPQAALAGVHTPW
jgi:hypothetical protein